jgi:hypothetical protein
MYEIRLIHVINREGDTIESWFSVVDGGKETIFQTWAEVEAYLVEHYEN